MHQKNKVREDGEHGEEDVMATRTTSTEQPGAVSGQETLKQPLGVEFLHCPLLSLWWPFCFRGTL